MDHEVRPIRALDADDARVVEVRVASPAALLVAKLHKLGERLGSRRVQDQDALDVLRLLRGTQTVDVAGRLAALNLDPVAGAATAAAVAWLEEIFVRRGVVGADGGAGRRAHRAGGRDPRVDDGARGRAAGGGSAPSVTSSCITEI